MSDFLGQLEAVRDALIDELDGAIKYEPILHDAMLGRDPKVPLLDKDVAEIKAQAEAIAQSGHAELVKRLREEITNDPEKLGYAGKPAEEIVALMNKERVEIVSEELVEVHRSRWSICNQGIPYCRNVLRVEEIEEALT